MNTQVKKVDAQALKTEITATVGNAKKAGVKMVELFVSAARHYWNNSESPDVLNHFLKELDGLPSLQKKVLTLACTFSKFEIIHDKEIPQLLNLRERDANGNVVKEAGKDKRVKLTSEQKTDYQAKIDAFEALQLKSLTSTVGGGKGSKTREPVTFGVKVKATDKVLEKRIIDLCVEYDESPETVFAELAKRLSVVADDPELPEKIAKAKAEKQKPVIEGETAK